MLKAVARKYLIRLFLTLGFIPVFFYLYREIPHIGTFMHEWGHDICGGNPLPNLLYISKDGTESATFTPMLFGETLGYAGSYIGPLLLAAIFQFIPNGIVKSFGIVTFFHFFGLIYHWREAGYIVDFKQPGALDLAWDSQLPMTVIFVISHPLGWLFNLFCSAKKLERKEQAMQREQEIRRKQREHVYRLRHLKATKEQPVGRPKLTMQIVKK